MTMPCSHPDLFLDDWLTLLWSNGREDEFDIYFGDDEEVLNMIYYRNGCSLNEIGMSDAR
jgi:hypothetical protein